MNTPAANNDYKQLYQISQKENRDLNFKLQQLQHELQQLKKMIFGSRQEKFIPTEIKDLLVSASPPKVF